MPAIWTGLGFAAFGALIGTIAGLSTAELTTMLLGLLFAMIGGSLGAFLGKLDDAGRKFVGIALLMFSLFATVGLYGGIFIRVNDILLITPSEHGTDVKSNTTQNKKVAYLQSKDVKLIEFLKFEIAQNRMTLPEACTTLEQMEVRNDQ